MIKFIILLNFLIITKVVTGQSRTIRWGKLTEEELKIKSCPFDSSANSYIIADLGTIVFPDGEVQIEVYRRTKILNNNGLDQADVIIPYYRRNNIEQIKNVEAQTININKNGKTQIIKVKTDLIYQVDVNKYYGQVRFTFPAVKTGSFIEFKYKRTSRNILYLNPWFFQNDLPTKYSELRVNFPPWLQYSIVTFGEKLNEKYFGKPNNENCWTLEDLPGFKSEMLVYNYSDYAEKIKFQLKSYEKWKDVLGGELQSQEVIKSWQDLIHEIYSYYKPYLNNRYLAKNTIENNIQSKDSTIDRIKELFYYVRNNFTWNNLYSILIDQDLNEFIKTRQGNSAEINLFLLDLLRISGINANPILISTRKNGAITKSYPLINQFNNLIICATIDRVNYFLDAATSVKSEPFNLLPINDLNLFGIKIMPDTFEWIEIPVPEFSAKNTLLDITFEEKLLKCQLSYAFSGYLASMKRDIKNNKITFNGYKEALYLCENELILKEIVLKNLDAIEQSFTTDLTYTGVSLQSNKDNYLFEPYLYADFKEFPFKIPQRKLPVEMEFPYSDFYKITFDIPKGYKIVNQPKNLTLNLFDNYAGFNYHINSNKEQFTLKIDFNLNKIYFPIEIYADLKRFYELIYSKLREPVILKKCDID